MNDGEHVRLVDIQKGSHEFNKVEKKFMSTANGTVNNVIKVICVCVHVCVRACMHAYECLCSSVQIDHVHIE